MKKFLIILALIMPLASTQAITIEEVKARVAQLLKEKASELPAFSVIDTQGKTHNNDSIKGKYLVVNFWATWCPPCLKEIPAFVDFYNKHSDRVEVIGMDYEQADAEAIESFLKRFNVTYPIVLFDEKNGPQFDVFGTVHGMPTTYIYSPEGKLVDFHEGEVDLEYLENAIR